MTIMMSLSTGISEIELEIEDKNYLEIKSP